MLFYPPLHCLCQAKGGEQARAQAGDDALLSGYGKPLRFAYGTMRCNHTIRLQRALFKNKQKLK